MELLLLLMLFDFPFFHSLVYHQEPRICLEDHAAGRRGRLGVDEQTGASSHLKDIINTLASQSRAFQISSSPNPAGNGFSLLRAYKWGASSSHFLNSTSVRSQILLQAHKQYWNIRAQFVYFFNPLKGLRTDQLNDSKTYLCLCIVQTIRTVHSEAYQNNVGL